jgi:hypothetical protein
MRSRPDLSAAALGPLERQTLGSVPGPVGHATMTRSPASRFGIVQYGDLAGDDAASYVPQLERLLTRLSDGALLRHPRRSTVPACHDAEPSQPSTSLRWSGLFAGPWSTEPSIPKREPWQGHSHARSASLK